jgi:hypothetical protein
MEESDRAKACWLCGTTELIAKLKPAHVLTNAGHGHVGVIENLVGAFQCDDDFD